MKKCYYTIYKITNINNGKFYVGMHKTENLDDGYFGSGKMIRSAIVKHGIENFTKEYIHIYETPEEMINSEKEIVNEDFVKRDDTYNINLGGEGSWLGSNQSLTPEQRRKISLLGNNAIMKLRNDPVWVEKCRETIKNGIFLAKEEGRFKSGWPNWKERHHKEETKKKIGIENSKHQKGEGNSNFGNNWIFSEEEKRCESVPKEDLDQWLEKGWKKGRKMKF